MPGRLPAQSDFTGTLQLTITTPPESTKPLNVLVLLHGLGGSNVPFTNLGCQLSLPETVCISLQASTPLPFELGGYHWGDDIMFDQNSGQMDLDTGFSNAVTMVKEKLILDGLVARCGYEPRDVVMFGFGQGGMAALETARSMEVELGGVISIGGPSPTILSKEVIGSAKSETPVLVVGGSSNTLITASALTNLRAMFQSVEYKKYERPGDSMPRNRAEMLPLMRFLSRRLKSRRGIPGGCVEIG